MSYAWNVLRYTRQYAFFVNLFVSCTVVIYNAAPYWPCILLHPGCFCLACMYITLRYLGYIDDIQYSSI